MNVLKKWPSWLMQSGKLFKTGNLNLAWKYGWLSQPSTHSLTRLVLLKL